MEAVLIKELPIANPKILNLMRDLILFLFVDDAIYWFLTKKNIYPQTYSVFFYDCFHIKSLRRSLPLFSNFCETPLNLNLISTHESLFTRSIEDFNSSRSKAFHNSLTNFFIINSNKDAFFHLFFDLTNEILLIEKTDLVMRAGLFVFKCFLFYLFEPR